MHTKPITQTSHKHFVNLKEFYGNKYFRDFCTYLIKSINTNFHVFAYIILDFK